MALDRSTTWQYEGGEPGRFFYQRYEHPAGVAAEDALSRLDGGHALLFPSGAGATTALASARISESRRLVPPANTCSSTVVS